MLLLRLNIFISRFELFLLKNLSFLPPSIKEKYAKKVCNDIVNIGKKLKDKNII